MTATGVCVPCSVGEHQGCQPPCPCTTGVWHLRFDPGPEPDLVLPDLTAAARTVAAEAGTWPGSEPVPVTYDHDAPMRGVDHRGTRYVCLDDLFLLVERYREAWAGHDAGEALTEMASGLAEWSEGNPSQ